MRVEAQMVVTLEYNVADEAGNVVDDGADPLTYVHGGADLFPKLQAALADRQIGDSVTVTLTPEDAFGAYDGDQVRVEPLSAFPEGIEPGMQVEGVDEDGENRLYTITDVKEDRVVVDSNHPLAGVTLVFTAKVAALRPATPEELAAQAARHLD